MSKKCFLCKSSVDNELLFGKFYSKWKLTVHYYCLLLSSNLVQRGSNDTVGIFGFLESDIRKENKRTKKCRCYICKDMHANVFCCSKKCLRTFHTACGIMNGCLSHYTDTYQSWCSAHVPLDPDTNPHTREEPCSICYDEMGQYDVITSIKAPCCRNGWFHQRCVAQYAQSAGYFFKCPLCNNEDKFLAEIPLRGVFVPERDAAWELEPDAFQEQLIRPTACDANVCKCREGRSVDNHQWRLVVCGSCGSTCRHRQCMEQQPAEGSRAYLCQLCRPILGDRLSVLENADSDDSSEDDTSTSCDETLGNIRRIATARKALLDGSDSERSDGSSIEIRRSIRQNTGKRVRRLMSEGSENEEASRTGRISNPSLSDDEDNETDENSCSSSSTSKAEVRSTRQLRRRLSSLSDSSKRSTSVSNMEDREPKRSTTRRPRIDSSSDDSVKRSEVGNHTSHATEDLPSHNKRYTTRQWDKKPTSSNQTRRPRLSTSSDDIEKRSEDGQYNSHATEDVASREERCSSRQRDKKPTSSNQSRRPRLSTSSDDFEKRSEDGKYNSHATEDVASREERYTTRQRDIKPTSSNQSRRPRLSTSSDDDRKRSESETSASPALDDPSMGTERHTTSQRTNKANLRSTKRSDPSTSCSGATAAMKNTKTAQEDTNSSCAQGIAVIPTKSNDRANSVASKRWDENSNMTGTDRSPPASEKGENASASDMSLENENTAARSLSQLTSRHLSSEAGERATSESSTGTIRPKRKRAARFYVLFDDSDIRTEDSENGSTDKLDSAPQTKQRRLARERCNQTKQSATGAQRHKTPLISPPSTPPSLASESSQQSVASCSGKPGVSEDGKQTGSGTLNLQQQSMLRFLTFSARKTAATSDSSDQSMEETVSPSRWSKFGSSNNINSKISPISNKRATTTKRRRTHSPKKSNKRSQEGQQPESGPTSSKTTAVQPRTTKGQFMSKNDGQKNILNYFNCY